MCYNEDKLFVLESLDIKVYINVRGDFTMKKKLLVIGLILLQIFTFFVAPIAFTKFDVAYVFIGMLLSTFGVSMMMIVVSKNKLRYLYPIVAALIFVPSVPIYYNPSAYFHIIYYFLVSVGGVLMGFMIDKFIDSLYNRK